MREDYSDAEIIEQDRVTKEIILKCAEYIR